MPRYDKKSRRKASSYASETAKARGDAHLYRNTAFAAASLDRQITLSPLQLKPET